MLQRRHSATPRSGIRRAESNLIADWVLHGDNGPVNNVCEKTQNFGLTRAGRNYHDQ
jgi:hypothetical protein